MLMYVLVTQLCPTLCDPRDLSPPGSSCQWNFPGKDAGVGCHFLLQGLFLTQGSNPHLQHWQPDFLPLSHEGSPQINITGDKTDNQQGPIAEHNLQYFVITYMGKESEKEYMYVCMYI